MNRILIASLVVWSGLFSSAPSHAGAPVWNDLAEIPILSDGRVKPLDSFARSHLLAFSSKSTLPDGQPAIDWLAEVLFAPEAAYNHKIFDIRNIQVLATLDVVPNLQHRYSLAELAPGFDRLKETLMALHNKEEDEKTPEQKQLLALYSKALRLNELTHAFADSELLKIVPAQWPVQGGPGVKPHAEGKTADWYSPAELRSTGQGSPESSRYLTAWKNLAEKYSTATSEQKADLARAISTEARQLTHGAISQTRLKLEHIYNNWDLFTLSLSFYVLAFLLVLASEIPAFRRFQTLSFVVMFLGFACHIVGLVMRITIMQRPPVATLYESIIFVGATVSFLSLIYEWIRKNRLGLIAGSAAGATLHFVANGYAADGDTMGMLAAVLNSNFWLATHVVVITIGYGCSIVAGILGHLYLVKAFILNRSGKADQAKVELADLFQNMVGASLIALFFALFGTILGGIWADQSWGRFWGWDPKENGALLLVLWLLMLLHGRLSGHLRAPGFAAGLVLTNAIVAIAWFGVNLLNVGLHSYGFTENVALNLFAFVGAEVLLATVGYGLAVRVKKIKVKS